MNNDLYTWKFAFDVMQTIVTFAIAVYVWILSKYKVNADKIKQLEDSYNADAHKTKERIARVETKIENMPGREQISRLHQRMDEVSKEVGLLKGEMKGVSDNTAMIIQLLVEKGVEK